MEESLIEPPTWYRLDLATGERTLLKRKDVPGYDPARLRDRAGDGAGQRWHSRSR